MRPMPWGAVLAAGMSAGCWPAVPDDWEPDRGELITRVRALEGDTFVKLKDGLARSLYEQLDSEERCVEPQHCRRRGEHLVCSTENLADPYVCELHLRDGAWVAPRADWELYHSAESNRVYGSARLNGLTLSLDGEAADTLEGQRGGVRVLTLRMPQGSVAADR